MPRRTLPLTHTGITAEHERKLKRRAAAVGFDPNADPVVIGLDAFDTDPTIGANVAIGKEAHTGGGPSDVYSATAVGAFAYANDEESTALGSDAGTSSPGATAVGYSAQASGEQSVAMGYTSNVDAGCASGIAIGFNANVSGSMGIAIGDLPQADGFSSIAIGHSTDATGDQAIAIGLTAHAGGNDAVAIGRNAGATDDDSVAIGQGASAIHDHGTALGAGSTTTAADQVMLGRAADTVVVPGTLAIGGVSDVEAALGATSAEAIRDTIAAALIGTGGIVISPDDPGDTITIDGTGITGGSGYNPIPIDEPAIFNGVFGTDDGYDYEFGADSTSLPSGYSAVGSVTYQERFGAGTINHPGPAGATDDIRAIVRALPSESTWTAYAKVRAITRDTNFYAAGLCLRESGTGEIVTFSNTRTGKTVDSAKWNSATSFNAALVSAFAIAQDAVYIKLARNSDGTYNHSVSPDGRAWYDVSASSAVASFLTPDQLGFFALRNGAVKMAASIEWLRVRTP